ncbi:DNA pilot protein [Apis mellifera associated microvirus 41]|nr:DNA pilot protein [Apis mellifera associated microvirus 41]
MSWLSAIGGLAGGVIDKVFGDRSADKAYQQQKEFAQSGIQWRVEDAKKAGIHPLYALGAQTHQFSPTTVGTDFAGVGQNLGRAIDATRTSGQRNDAVSKTMQDLELTRMSLSNDLLRQQIAAASLATARQASSVPAMASPGDRYLIEGQGNSPLVQSVPLERTAVDPDRMHQEAGAVSDVGHLRTQSGGYAPTQSYDAHQRLEEDALGGLQWNVRNRILPVVSDTRFAPPHQARPGYVWVFNMFTGEYSQVKATGTPNRSLAYD